MNWLQKISYEVHPFSFEDDEYPGDVYQDAEQAEAIFKEREVGVDRNKELSHMAVEDGQVIGAVSSSWSHEDGVDVFSFDVAVKRQYQGTMAGMKLIQEAIKQYEWDKSMYEGNTMMRLWVVNERLIPILVRRFGFEIESEHEGGSAHLIRY